MPSSPVNTIKTQPLEPILQELVKMGAQPQGPLFIAVRDVLTATQKTLTIAGQIQPQAPIGTAAVGVGTQTQNLTDTGTVTAAGVGFTLTAVPDDPTFQKTTPNQVAGAGRAFVALDTNNRLAGSFRANAVNVSSTPTAATALSNDGVSTAIAVAATTAQFGDGPVSYNSGSVDPGTFGTWYVFADDPTFAGGAVTYQFSATPVNQTAANGRVLFGKIITVLGTSKTGGGNTGGTTPGGGGGRGFIQ